MANTEQRKGTADDPIIIHSEYAAGSSRPYFMVDLALNSIHTHHILERGYEGAADGVFQLEVILPALTSVEEAAKVQDTISTKIAAVWEELKAEHARFAKIAESAGISSDGFGYTATRHYKVEVTSPEANTLIRMLADFDKMIGLVDCLWLTGTLSRKQYATATHDWKRRWLRLTQEIRDVGGRAVAAVNRSRTQREKPAADSKPASAGTPPAAGGAPAKKPAKAKAKPTVVATPDAAAAA